MRNAINSKNFEFVIIYGRRRIGKTKLMLKVLKEAGKGKYYFYMESLNMKQFKREFNLERISDNWYYLLEHFTDDVLVMDEFPYLIKEYP